MVYDAVIIGAGLSGYSSALKIAAEGKKAIILARGMGNLYSSSGYIDILGYYPTTSRSPVSSPEKALEKLIAEKPEHPYSITGIETVKEALELFLETMKKAGLPYGGSIDTNILMPTATGSFVPATFYPETSDKNLAEFEHITVCGIEEMMDFFPSYVASGLEKELKKKINFSNIKLGIDIQRELNSYDIALFFEKKEIQKKFIEQIKTLVTPGNLILCPAVLGVKSHREIIKHLEIETECKFLEIPTLPPSLMGYRLAEGLRSYLKKIGVEMITGYPVDYVKTEGNTCKEAGIATAGGKIKKITCKSYILATGGILGEGLQVYPDKIREAVFDLPVTMPEPSHYKDFFDLRENPLSCAGVRVNKDLNPVDFKGNVILKNVFVAGATLGGYDPFLEKSGNGVALATGYKAALEALKAGEDYE